MPITVTGIGVPEFGRLLHCDRAGSFGILSNRQKLCKKISRIPFSEASVISTRCWLSSPEARLVIENQSPEYRKLCGAATLTQNNTTGTLTHWAKNVLVLLRVRDQKVFLILICETGVFVLEDRCSDFLFGASFIVPPNSSGIYPWGNSGKDSKEYDHRSFGYSVLNEKPGGTIKVQSTWTVPSVECSATGQILTFTIQIDHIYQGDTASELYVSCTGTVASYVMEYSLGGTSGTLVSPILPGDKIQITESVATKTGLVSIDIKDITRGWDTGITTRNEPIDVTQVGEIDFWLCGNSMPSLCTTASIGLARFTNLKTTGDMITLGPHHGSIGSFLGVSSDYVTKYSVVDNVGTVETRPSTISSTSTGFSILWLAGL